MVNKLKFNNLVISNKKGIQQSRIQTINKLVHKIRKLKTLLEKHPDDMKCKERIRKSSEAMELLKKIKRVEIMKKVLLMDKQPAAVITNGLATPEEVAIALLAINKVMMGLTKRFKTELLLDESKRAEWQKVLTETSKRRQKKERIEEKRRKRLEIKQQKTIGRKRQEWLDQNYPKEKNDNKMNENLNISTIGSWNIEEMDNEVQENEKLIIKDVVSKPLKEKLKKADIPNKKQEINTEKEYENELEAIKTKSSQSELEDNENHESSEEDIEEPLVVDPFFITDTGKNYLSTAVVKQNQNANENCEIEKMNLHMIKLNNYEERNRDFKDRRQKLQDKNRNNFRNKTSTNKDQRLNEKTNMWSTNNNKKSKDFNFDKSARKTNEKDLHPSWAAKQKLKPVITGFQGKKIKFDDNAVHQNKNTISSTLNDSRTEQDSLHPSWAAKQKLKPTITTFQGKKITFDNDD